MRISRVTNSKVTSLSARVAATVAWASTQTEGRTVSLNVSNTLAMIALLGCADVSVLRTAIF